MQGNKTNGIQTWGTQSTAGENQIRWGNPFGYSIYNHSRKSGLGFAGVGSTSLVAGDIFQLGTLSHFNNVIYGNTASAAVDLTISLDFLELGTQQFDFTLEIDETPNVWGSCPYYSTRACSDRISWVDAVPDQTFAFGKQQYTLELLGFRQGFNSPMVTDFISQEGGTSQAYLYGKITAVGLPDEPIKAVPEPATAMGIALVSLYFAASRRQQNS